MKTIVTLLTLTLASPAFANTTCKSPKLGTLTLSHHHAFGCAITFEKIYGDILVTEKEKVGGKLQNKCRQTKVGNKTVTQAYVFDEMDPNELASKAIITVTQEPGQVTAVLSMIEGYTWTFNDLKCATGPSLE